MLSSQLKENVSRIIPRPTLTDLSNSESEIDNDIHFLLDWLQPFFPQIKANASGTTNGGIQAPSQRVKAAMRSCLKDDANQIGFIKLYMNSINIEFHKYFNSTDLSTFTFVDYYHLIREISGFYAYYIDNMKLNELAKDLFQRNLNSLFRSHLIVTPTRKSPANTAHFIQCLSDYLYNSLFKSTNVLYGIMSNDGIATTDIISLLFSVNFTNEVNFILIQLSIQKIKQFVLVNCATVWNKPLLDLISDFIQTEIYPNISIILKCSPGESFDDAYLYELIKIAHDELVSVRISEIYDLILQFPESMHGLEELHHCLSIKYNHHHYNEGLNESSPQRGNFLPNIKAVMGAPQFNSTTQSFQTLNNNSINDVTNLTKFSYLANYSLKTQAYQRAKLVDTFITMSSSNLLHSGADTVDVITTYTKTIKSFLIIDPKGVLLDKVVRPIRMYLKTREDIIVKLVHGLLDEDDESNQLIELVRELRASRTSKDFKRRRGNNKSRFDESEPDIGWQPDPIDALPDFKKGKVTDIIESLISIFDSKEIFINEFTKLLGEKLVSLHNYDTSAISEQLDLLKSRFGKNEFSTLDIMIKDINDSKSINLSINGRNKVFHSSILSHLFWPSVLGNINSNVDMFTLPPMISEKFESYNNEFSQYKRGRSLELLPSLGLVKLELEIKNQTMIFEVSTDKAAIISLFDERSNELSVDYIAKTLNMSPYLVSKGLAFWVQKKVLLELTKTLYMSNEEDDDEEVYTDPSASSGTKEQSISNKPHANSLSIIVPYLSNIMESIKSAPFEKIKSLLNLTVPQDKLDLGSIPDNDLEQFLDQLVDENVLLLSNGNYRAKK